MSFVKAFRVCLLVSISYFFISLAFAAEKTDTQFLVLTDIHFDPFINCQTSSVSPCPFLESLKRTDAQSWPAIFAASDKNVAEYRQDTNYQLLLSALSAAKSAAQEKKIQFVLVLGDFLGHDFRKYYKKYSHDKTLAGYQAFVKKTFEFLNMELANTFPKTNVFMLVGNNDSYHEDYSSKPNGHFFLDMSTLWSQLIQDRKSQDAMRHEFPYAGYYAVTLPNQPDVKLIMLNTVLFSSKAKSAQAEKAALDELKWLHDELASAKAAHQKTFIAMHIPPGVDVYATLKIRLFTLIALWKKNYSEQFQAELHEYSGNIAGIFAGHLHSDWFQILTFPDSKNEIPVIGTPAISPLFGNNPGFKVFSYSKTSRNLTDFITYYYPLYKPSYWQKEYDFNLSYQPHCQACPLIKGMKAIVRKGPLAEQYRRFYAVNTEAQPITTHWDPYYWCAIWAINPDNYKKCLNA